MFDDGSFPKRHSQSRTIRLRIDWRTRTVSLIGRYVRTPPLLTGSQGNDQVLSSGGSFVGWGEQPYFSEFSPSGQILFEANIPFPTGPYRAYTFPWTGAPASPPSLAVSPSSGEANTVYASWNGATGVSAWRVLAGPNPAQLSTIATAQREVFRPRSRCTTPSPTLRSRRSARPDRRSVPLRPSSARRATWTWRPALGTRPAAAPRLTCPGT